MTYQSAIEYLFGLQKFGMKFGLDNIRKLTALSGEPQRSFRSVHVAGTNGKGSTSAMIESMLRTSGMRTGLFTSPHLVSFTERIRINSTEITEDDVVNLASRARAFAEAVEEFSPTFFEIVTLMGFLAFKDAAVDWAVVETGMGGRLDATNVLVPEVSVITPVSIDHAEFLGRTIAEIAREKAGIIKHGVPVVLAVQPEEAASVFEQKAAEVGAPVHRYGRDFRVHPIGEGRFDYEGFSRLPGLKCALAGDHQIMNAAVAVRAVEVLAGRCNGLAPDIGTGLAAVRWRGRLELVKENPPIMIDGAHNPEAAATLARHLSERVAPHGRIILVVGIMADKDIRGILAPLLPLSATVIAASPAYERAAAPETIIAQAEALGYHGVRSSSSVADALCRAEEAAGPEDLIVVTGSFYTIGEAMEALGSKSVLARLRE